MQRRHVWLTILIVLIAAVVSRHSARLAPVAHDSPGPTTAGAPTRAPGPTPDGAATSANSTASAGASAPAAAPDTGAVDNAFHNHSSNVMVTAAGTVARVLPDDRQGLQHQRFVLRMPSGLTVLVAHDIDEAPRVPDLRAGQPLLAHGEYVWNAQGGIVHWTHHDSSGRHASGWIDYDGRRYQ